MFVSWRQRLALCLALEDSAGRLLPAFPFNVMSVVPLCMTGRLQIDLKLKMGSLLPSRVMPVLRVEEGRLIWLDASPLSDSSLVFDIVDQLGSIARAIDHIQSDHMRYWLTERVTSTCSSVPFSRPFPSLPYFLVLTLPISRASSPLLVPFWFLY